MKGGLGRGGDVAGAPGGAQLVHLLSGVGVVLGRGLVAREGAGGEPLGALEALGEAALGARVARGGGEHLAAAVHQAGLSAVQQKGSG